MNGGLLNLPLGLRLQAIERNLELADKSDGDSDVDLEEFYRRRNQELRSDPLDIEDELISETLQKSHARPVPASVHANTEVLGDSNQSVANTTQVPEARSSEGTGRQSSVSVIEPDAPVPKSPEELQLPEPVGSPDNCVQATAESASQSEGRSDTELRAEIYADAGLDLPSSPVAPSSSRLPRPLTKKAEQQTAQDTARRRRCLDQEIETHTAASATVELFMELFNQRTAAEGQSEPPSGATDGFDGLEIVGESTPPTSPMGVSLSSSPIVRKKVKNGSRIESKTKHLFAMLQEKQREQALRNRQVKVEALEAKGVEPVSEKQRAKEEVMAATLLEQERQEAEELRRIERGEYDEEGDHLLSFDESANEDGNHAHEDEEADCDLDLSGAEESDDHAHTDSQEETPDRPYKIRTKQSGRNALLSDDSDSGAGKGAAEITLSQTQVKESVFQNSIKAHAEATQIVPRLDPTAIAKLQNPLLMGDRVITNDADMGSSSDEEDVNNALENLRNMPQSPVAIDEAVSAEQEQQQLRRLYLHARQSRLNNQATKMLVEDQAEESEDEWAGLGGVSNDEDDGDENEVLEDLVDDTERAPGAGDLHQVFNKQELDRDEALVRKVVDDVNGGWRRRALGKGMLEGMSDSDSDGDNVARRKAQEAKKRAKLLEYTDMSRLATDDKTKAFVESMASDLKAGLKKPTHTSLDSVQDSLKFLVDTEEPLRDALPAGPEDLDPTAYPLPRNAHLALRSGKASVLRAIAAASAAKKRTSTYTADLNVDLNRNGPLAGAPPAKRKLRPSVASRRAVQAAPRNPERDTMFRRDWS